MVTTRLADDVSRYEQLRKLTEISRALTYSTHIDQILRLAVRSAAELLRSERALLMLLDSTGLLQVSATHGIERELVDRFRQPLDEGLVTRIQGMLGVSPESATFIGVPLVMNGAVKGLLGVVRASPDPSTEDEEWILSAVADQVAVAMENSRLEQEAGRARKDRAKAAEKADNESYMKDTALATLSHDLRSPLNAIDSFAELMEMEILGPVTDRQREALGRIRMGGRHLVAVLQNVLEMARIETGAVRLKAVEVDMKTVVDEAALMVRHSSVARRQTVRVDATESLVCADPDSVRQVLINLLSNAVKYTPPGGTIDVAVRRVDDEGGTWGEVAIKDNGVGIPEEHLELIFAPYYRVQRPDSEETDGAGLGLAISRELIRRMNGTIQVLSRPKEGATFTIRLPAAPANPEESCKPEEGQAESQV